MPAGIDDPMETERARAVTSAVRPILQKPSRSKKYTACARGNSPLCSQICLRCCVHTSDSSRSLLRTPCDEAVTEVRIISDPVKDRVLHLPEMSGTEPAIG